MASSRYSAGDVLSSVFAEEEIFDDSDSEIGDDIYGYLVEYTLPREELEEEARGLMGGRDHSCSSDLAGQSIASNLASNSEEPDEERFEGTRSSDDGSHSLHSNMEVTSLSREHETEDMVVDPASPTLRSDVASSIGEEVVSEVT